MLYRDNVPITHTRKQVPDTSGCYWQPKENISYELQVKRVLHEIHVKNAHMFHANFFSRNLFKSFNFRFKKFEMKKNYSLVDRY